MLCSTRRIARTTLPKTRQHLSPSFSPSRTLLRGLPHRCPRSGPHFLLRSRLVTYTDSKGNTQPEDGSVEALEERTQSIDHLLGAIVASYGFHASLVWESDTPEYRKHGAKRFGMAAHGAAKAGPLVQRRGRGAPASAWRRARRGYGMGKAGVGRRALQLRPRNHGLEPREDFHHLPGKQAAGWPAAARTLRRRGWRENHGKS